MNEQTTKVITMIVIGVVFVTYIKFLEVIVKRA